MVGLPAAAGNEVEQPGPGVAVRIRSQVDRPAQFLRATAALLGRLGANVVPDVLIHSEVGDPLESGRVRGDHLQQQRYRLPLRAPAAAEPETDPVDPGVLAADLFDRPAA